jgi:rfaE bifunctional protein nucleotidyltransferase chain/domain
LLAFGDGPPLVIPAPPVRCVDACGAGDRFSGVFIAMLAGKSLPSEAARAAVEAASEFVEHGSPQGDVLEDGDVLSRIAGIRARGGTVVATGGCFDLLHAGHVATLRAARRLGDFLVVLLNSDASVRRLKGPGRPLVRVADRLRVLEALECVDAVVVFDEDSPSPVLNTLRPDIWAKGGDYGGCPLPEAQILQSWGGQAVVLPYLDGRSTTALVAAAAQKSTLKAVSKSVSKSVSKPVSAKGASR